MSDLWNLEASPSALEELASGWRKLQQGATSAQDTVDQAAYRVFADEAWLGESADSYDNHRQRLTKDIGKLADQAGPIAEALDYLAEVLRLNQELLSQERAKLASVPSTGSEGNLRYHPRDEKEKRLVMDAVNAAHEIRERVDQALVAKKGDFQNADSALTAIRDAWRPQTVRMMNLNIGQGAGNSPGDEAGTDQGDIGKIAERIAKEGADIVTMQEVFGQDVDDLEKALEERTGQQWTLHFGKASDKIYADAGIAFPGNWSEPFGNVVAVKHGDEIKGIGDTETIKLDVPGDKAAPGVDDGEGRSATEVEVRFNTRR